MGGGVFNHCTFNLNPRETSIDTASHGSCTHPHVDHVHADAVIAISSLHHGGTDGRGVRRRARVPAIGSGGLDLGLKLGEIGGRIHPVKMLAVVLGRPRSVYLGPDFEGGIPDHVAHYPEGS